MKQIINELNLIEFDTNREIQEIDALIHNGAEPGRWLDTLIYTLIGHIEYDNVNNCRFPRPSFKDWICPKHVLNIRFHIIDILQKVYNPSIKQSMSAIMYQKMYDENGEPKLSIYNENMNEFYKFSVYQKLQFNNQNYILEAALAIQTTYLTARGRPLFLLNPNSFKDHQLIVNLKNSLNSYKKIAKSLKRPKIDLVDLNNLSQYNKFVILVAGYATVFKAVDSNWQYIPDHPLNHDPEPEDEKTDIYVKVKRTNAIIPSNHIFTIPFKNDNIIQLTKNEYNDLVDFETIRWQNHKITTKIKEK